MKERSWAMIVGIVAVSVLAAGGLWVYDSAAATADPAGLVAANGRIEIEEVRVAPGTGGRVERIVHPEGHRIEPGDTLALLDRRAAETNVTGARSAVAAARAGVVAAEGRARALESQLELARVEARRYRRLYDRDAAPRQAAEQAEAALARLENETHAARAARSVAEDQVGLARARLDAALLELDETVLRSPAAGVVSQVLVRQGERAAPGWPVLALRLAGEARLKVYLPVEAAGRVAPGSDARIYVDAYPERVFEASVERIADEAEFTPRDIHMPDERSSLVYEVVLRVIDPEGALKDGFPADAWIRWDDSEAWPDHAPW